MQNHFLAKPQRRWISLYDSPSILWVAAQQPLRPIDHSRAELPMAVKITEQTRLPVLPFL